MPAACPPIPPCPLPHPTTYAHHGPQSSSPSARHGIYDHGAPAHTYSGLPGCTTRLGTSDIAARTGPAPTPKSGQRVRPK
eukprot:4149774-Pyramimonas_sp.AAC.1